MRTLADHEKAMLFLFVENGNEIPREWGDTKPDRQRNVLAALCFNGSTVRADDALHQLKYLGYANKPEEEQE